MATVSGGDVFNTNINHGVIMKNIFTVLSLFLFVSTSYAKTIQCTADDTTVIRADIIERSMSAELINISVQKFELPPLIFPENVKGVLYTDVTGNPVDPVVLSIYDDSTNPPTELYKIAPDSRDPNKRNALTENGTNVTHPVSCIEI